MKLFKDSIFWVEIAVADFDRAKKFYSTIYDYDMPDIMAGPNQMGFLPHDRDAGGIGAAIVKGADYTPANIGIKIVLNGGNDLGDVLDRVEKAGGKVIMPKKQVSPSFGCLGAFEDTEGNVIQLHSMK
ncbi:VOC family protein [Chitinophaga sp. SYP-B3965]|uniref:VOC family protein n=1 Tax=Chitinophaga sp. SYP-B3965 TaxID=2663120 RepID=UPI001299BDF4|nr:VOC family protein [Chitinophaga sp. SYP-B3965]MRG45202.1 VOC family protein [Chitinophaga sp. SYP-B3965]